MSVAQVLHASEDVLRRYGPGQATVVDVARELGASHGSLYGHFPGKAALRLGRARDPRMPTTACGR